MVTRLVWLPPELSSLPTAVRLDTAEPVYTPSSVSKLLPMVSTTAWPVPGEVQAYQTECPPALPAWLGSPVSLVAPTLVPVAEGVLPLRTLALAKLSFAGPEGAP